MEGFTALQACRLTGCTAHQLRYWDRVGLVRPSIQATGGRPGVRRLYSFRDLVALKVIRDLLSGGMSLQRVRRAYDYLRKRAGLEQHLSEVRLVTDGRSIYEIYSDDGRLSDALRDGQLAFFATLGEVVRNAQGRASDYLYDREEFLAALKRLETELAGAGQEAPPAISSRAAQ